MWSPESWAARWTLQHAAEAGKRLRVGAVGQLPRRRRRVFVARCGGLLAVRHEPLTGRAGRTAIVTRGLGRPRYSGRFPHRRWWCW
jgi:hypothetical protein